MDTTTLAREAHQHFAAGRLEQALASYNEALARDPGLVEARLGLDALLEGAATERAHAGLAAAYLAAYADPAANWDAIGNGAARQLDLAWPGDPSAEALAGNALLPEFLHKSLNRNPALERRLLALRQTVARRLIAGDASPAVGALATALAEQAWMNEYLWPDDPTVPDGPAGALFRPQSPPRSHVAAERHLAATIPAMGPITDATSVRVAALYEANPYPRWSHLPRQPRLDIRRTLAARFPHAAPVAALDGPLQVLMPGAGTGQHPLSVATSYERAHVVAIDLSRNSLAFAARMARRSAVANVEFLQGDLLDLGRLGRQFDHTECIGVLHHLASPRTGLLALAGVLRPGAFARLSVYSESGRRVIDAARAEIARAGLPATVAGVREFHRGVLDGRWPALAPLVDWEDFWSTSPLRDLCFHVQETRFTIASLRTFLAGSGLRFLGFEFRVGAAHLPLPDAPPLALYRARYPDEPTLADLERWERLESEFPDLFPGYAFVCQKE